MDIWFLLFFQKTLWTSSGMQSSFVLSPSSLYPFNFPPIIYNYTPQDLKEQIRSFHENSDDPNFPK